MDGVARAVSFVERVGDESEQIRLRCTLSGETAAGADAWRIFLGQRPDGGFAPPWNAEYSGIDATCMRLAQADQANLGPTWPGVIAALAFLAGRQDPDGHWQESAGQAALAPPWAQPADASARLYLTANASFWLAALGPSPQTAKAARYLMAAARPAGLLPSFLHANWLAAALYWSLGETAAAEELLGQLEDRLADLSASTLAWLITALTSRGVPVTHPLVVRAVPLLLIRQRADGAFPSDDGPRLDAHSTLEAMRALRLSAAW